MASRRYRLVRAGDLPVLSAPLEAAGWSHTTGDDWNLWWSDELPDGSIFAALEPGRMANHIPGVGVLAAKDRLANTIDAAAARLRGRAGDVNFAFHPKTFALPEAQSDFLQAAAAPQSRWIRKPRGGARGEGVALVADADEAARLGGRWLVQEYLANPHLLDGYKYTLRCYVAITSVVPLCVYVFDDGFTKLASRPFPRDPTDRSRFAHLTNPDVLAADSQVATSSRNLTRPAYAARLCADGHDAQALFDAIDRIVAKVVAAAREPLRAALTLSTGYPAGCFELLGLDFLVDADLRPWLLECNLTPSLIVEADPSTATAREEAALKSRVVADLAALVGLTGPRPGPGEPRVKGFRCVFPSPATGETWSSLTLARAADLRLAQERSIDVPDVSPLVPTADTITYDLGDSLAVHAPAVEDLLLLNATAAHVWLGVEDGLGRDPLIDELVAATGAPVARVTDDVDGLFATWREQGLLADAPSTPVVSVPSTATPLLRWNIGLAYRCLGTTVAVHAPSWDVAGTVAAALGSPDDDASVVDHFVEIRVERGGYRVAVDGAVVSPTFAPESIAVSVRRVVIALVAASCDRVVAHGAVLAVDTGAVVVLGESALRAALLRSWCDRGGGLLSDELVAFDDEPARPFYVGWEERVTEPRRRLDTWVAPDASIFITPEGVPVRYVAMPEALRTRDALDVVAIVVARSPVDSAEPQGDFAGPLTPRAVLEAALRWRPAGAGGISRNAAAALIRCIVKNPGWLVDCGDPAAACGQIAELAQRAG